MVMNLYRRIDRSIIQFDFVVCAEGKGAFEDEICALGGRIYRVPCLGPGAVIRFVKAWEELFRSHPEYKIIHGHLRSSASIYLSVARRHGLITIVHSHSTSNGKGLAAIAKFLLQLPLRKTADYLIGCSNAAGIWLFGEKATKRDNYFVLYNALDAEKFVFDAHKRREVRHALSLEDQLVIGHIGSFIPVKNHSFIIDIFSEIHKIDGDAILMLIGDGALRESVEQHVRDLKLWDRVIFMGIRQDIPNLLCAMDVFLLPSKWEGLPLTAVEAQASGLPCVLSDVISEETKISQLVSFMPLSTGAGDWAEKIAEVSGNRERPDMTGVIRQAGYDTADTANKLQAFYLNVLEEHSKL